MRQIPLRRSLFLQFFGLSLAPLLVVVLIIAAVMARSLITDVERETEVLGVAVRNQIEARLEGRQTAVELLAFALASQDNGEAREHLMRELIRADPVIELLYATDPGGAVERVALGAGSGLQKDDLLHVDLSSRPFYRAARATLRPVWSDTFLSALTGRVTAALAVPAGADVLVAEMSLLSLSQSIAELAAPTGDLIMALDSQGRIIGHPDAALASRQVSVRELALVREGVAGRSSRGSFEWEGTRYIGSVSHLGRTGWSVLVARPGERVYAQLFQLGWALVIGLALSLTGALAVALLLARSSERRYRTLVQAADSYAQAKVPPPIRFDILEFDQMWQNLRRLFEQIEQRDAETRAARSQLQTVFDATTEVSIIATRADGVMTVFNRGAEKLLGYEAGRMVGHNSVLMLHDAAELAQRARELSSQLGRTVEGFETLVAVPAEAGYEVRDWTYIRQDGSHVNVSVAFTAVRNGGATPTGYLAVATDQTEQLRAAGLEMARQVAEAANQNKSEFLSRISHDLRTPLNAMLGFAQLLAMDTQEPLTQVQRGRVALIESAGWHLVRLIDDVLDLSRIDSGQMRISMEAVGLVAAIHDAARLVARQAEEGGVTLSYPVPADDPGLAQVFAWADRTRLIQVFVNLMSNAVKYNRRGGQVIVEVDNTRPDSLQIVVSDTGRGMNAEQMARLFEPFDRLGMEASNVPGTGIGLVIVRRLLELMDGSVDVHSKAGSGTRVTVRVRRVAPPPGAAVETRAEPMGLLQPARAVADVVCVEDNAVNSALFEQIFALRPACRLHVAGTREQGLALVRRLRPRLVLLDLHLPDGSGLGLLEQLRRDEQHAGTPVIVISADATSHSERTARNAGAQAYLSKPIQIAEVLAAIDAALGSR